MFFEVKELSFTKVKILFRIQAPLKKCEIFRKLIIHKIILTVQEIFLCR